MLIKRRCPSCSQQCLGTWDLLRLIAGFRVRCRGCGVKLKESLVYDLVFSILLVVLTVFLLIFMTNRYGVKGFYLSFVIPLILVVMSLFWVPVSVSTKK